MKKEIIEYRKKISNPQVSKDDLFDAMSIPKLSMEAWGIFLSLKPDNEDFIKVIDKAPMLGLKAAERLLSQDNFSNNQIMAIIKNLNILHCPDCPDRLDDVSQESIDPLIEKFYKKLVNQDPNYEDLIWLSAEIPFLRKRIWQRVTTEKGLNLRVVKDFRPGYSWSPRVESNYRMNKSVDISLIKEYISLNKDKISKKRFPKVYLYLCFGTKQDKEIKDFFKDNLFEISFKDISSKSEFEEIIGHLGGSYWAGKENWRRNLVDTEVYHLLDIFLTKKLNHLNRTYNEPKEEAIEKVSKSSAQSELSSQGALGFLSRMWQKVKEENQNDFAVKEEKTEMSELEKFFTLMDELSISPNEILASTNKLDISSDIREEILLRYEDRIRFKDFPLFGEDSIFRGLKDREIQEKEKAQERINYLLGIDYSRTQSFKPNLSGAVGVNLSAPPKTVKYKAVQPDDIREVMGFVSGCIHNNLKLDDYTIIIEFLSELVSNLDHYFSVRVHSTFQERLAYLKEEIQRRKL